MADYTRKVIGSNDAKFQIVSVNPAFDDRSSEILLLIRSQGITYEYSLNYPKKQGVVPILAMPMQPEARAFPYRGGLAFLEDFMGPAKGIYLLQPPLKSGVKLHLIPVGSSEFEEIAKELKFTALDGMVKQQFCGSLPFASFYEKYAASCGWTAEDYANNPSVHNFNAFWLKD